MLAYKLKGKIDAAGNLAIGEPVNIPPGDVEVIILQIVETVSSSTVSQIEGSTPQPKRNVECSIPILKEWLENTEPAPSDFDPDQAKWDYLKKKYNL
ncbi:MAG TPA: hypothetical protein DCL61_30265 [Cyanobacteria bacterium UBA12227]|nr:hypothetical protein [Cyanobacteria bacterium UBA12227]HAX90208.1 hypothetical protein [Cyanobacteria bacterium UBA11370]HBY78444.1 hypothetical protein [Cyanobacteria bacterium UBA11148]